MKPEYAVQIIWSPEDEAYLACPFELPGCVADGATPEEALKNLRVVIQEWIDVATEEGRPIPKPMTVEDHEKVSAQFQLDLQRHIYQQVQNAVQQVLSQIAEQQQHVAWGHTVFRGVELVEK
jgi:predicted RNase H-like HicB family nuclease